MILGFPKILKNGDIKTIYILIKIQEDTFLWVARILHFREYLVIIESLKE